jgi:hypothetical protein
MSTTVTFNIFYSKYYAILSLTVIGIFVKKKVGQIDDAKIDVDTL